jgi:hypothetical protein
MIKTIKLINSLIANANPNNYDNVSYNKYYRDLSNISNSILEDNSKLRKEVLNIKDEDLKRKILELL